MQIIREISMHLDRREPTPFVEAVQGETVRSVSLALFEKNKPWTIPTEATVMIRYSKPDCTGGVYDSLPDGSRAWDIHSNVVDIRIAPQALAVAGVTAMQIAINTEGQELATFIFHLRVEADPSIGTRASDDYINIGQWLMPRIYAFVSQAETAASQANTAADQASMSADWSASAASQATQCVNMATTAANQAMHSATLAENAAQEAAKTGVKTVNGIAPDENGNVTVSTGSTQPGQDGLSPHIGQNGNWFIGDADTGVKAEGEKGEKGDKGDTGADGKDYVLTPADKVEIVAAVLDSIPYPVFGTVGENNSITLSGSLPDGSYTLKYEMADGSFAEIGTITLGSGAPIVNLLETAVGADGAVFNGTGYMDGYYLTGSSSANPIYVAAESGVAHFVTGYIPYTLAQAQAQTPIYVKGANIDTAQSHERIGFYPSLTHAEWLDPLKLSVSAMTVTKLSDGYFRIVPPANVLTEGGYGFTDIQFIRLSLSGSGAGVIITVGQEIPD